MEKIGINLPNLITQIVNFSILVFVLSRIVYKPILDILEKRKKKIEEGLMITESMLKEKEELEKKKQKVLEEARNEARAIVEKSRDEGKKVEQEVINQARKKAEEIIEHGKKDVEIRKKELEERMNRLAVDLATELSKKVVVEILDDKKQEIIVRKRVAQFLRKTKLE